MVSAASGDASVGIVVLGHEVQVTVSGYAGSLGGSVHAGYKEGELGFGADIAAVIGIGFDVTIKRIVKKEYVGKEATVQSTPLDMYEFKNFYYCDFCKQEYSLTELSERRKNK